MTKIGAKIFYKKGLTIFEQLAAETGAVEMRWDLSVSYGRLGDISQTKGDLDEAKVFYEKCLAIFEQLTAETGAVQAQRDLAVCYNRLGNINQAQGDLDRAKDFYEKGLAIFEQVAAKIGTIDVYDNLAISYYNMFRVAKTLKEELEYLHKAEMLWSWMVAQCPDVPLYKNCLAVVRGHIR